MTLTREDVKANLFITFSAADSDSHLQVLLKISELLQESAKAEKIFAAKAASKLYGYFTD